MHSICFCTQGSSPALAYAIASLRRRGFSVCESPGADVTHLLLPVPSLTAEGRIAGGGAFEDVLASLPEGSAVFGGNLPPEQIPGRPFRDFLQDPFYLAENAAITAHCAVKVALNHLPVTPDRCPVLVIGWGRIGKCLARLLRALGAAVTVSARRPEELALAQALGYSARSTGELSRIPGIFRLVFNTVPAPVLDEEGMTRFPADCVFLDLASRPGIIGPGVIQARGLPAKDAPESSGELIAETALRFVEGRI